MCFSFLLTIHDAETVFSAKDRESDTPRKRRKVEQGLNIPESQWADFEQDVRTFEVQHVHGNGKFAFGFVEGPLVKALRTGHWCVHTKILHIRY